MAFVTPEKIRVKRQIADSPGIKFDDQNEFFLSPTESEPIKSERVTLDYEATTAKKKPAQQ